MVPLAQAGLTAPAVAGQVDRGVRRRFAAMRRCTQSREPEPHCLASGSYSEWTCHQRGLRETYEWYVGASSFRCGLSNAPVTRATVGSSSSAPIVVPQLGQKARLEYEDERQTAGLPAGPTHSTLLAGNSTQVRVSEPECLRQVVHEHVCGLPG